MKSRKFKRGEQFFFQIIDDNGNVKMESNSFSDKEDRNKALDEAMNPYVSKGNADDYKPLNFYESNSNSENGFDKFDADGEFYFCYCANGVVHLISEGYSSESGRDNGIASVEKNMANKDRYSVNPLANGKWSLNLKAGNHQEIATSRWYNSEGEANNALAALSGGGSAAAIAGRMASIGGAGALGAVDAPKKRKKRKSSKPKAEKIPISDGSYTYNDVKYYIHKSSGNGQYYFSFKNPKTDKTILMNSDVRGFSSEAEANAGIKAVFANANVKSKYDDRATKNGKFWFYLTDGKDKNVGKSIFFGSKEDMQTAIGLLVGPPGGAAKAGASAASSDGNQDEYLPLVSYTGNKSDINKDFITFEQDGQYYFAWMVDGKVYMRSQGYTAEAGRDNGINSVINNRDKEERYADLSDSGQNFVILKAGNSQEIARSGPISEGWTQYRSAGLASLGLGAAAIAVEEARKKAANEAARQRIEAEAKRKEDEARLQAEAEAKRKAEEEARLKAEAEAKQKAEEEARLKAEAEAKQKAEEEARLTAEAEAKQKAEEEARAKAEAEAKQKAEEEARLKAEAEAKQKAEEEARLKAEAEAKQKAEEEARVKAEAEAKQKAEEEARVKAEAEAKRKAEEEARLKAEAEAKQKAEEEARVKAETEAKQKAEEEARVKAEAEAKQKAEEEARVKAEAEAKRKAEEEARVKAETEAKRKVEEEARVKAEADAKRKAEEAAKAKADEERKSSQATKIAAGAAMAGAGALGAVKMSNKDKGDEDDYLVCSVYEKRLLDSRSSKYPEFITFKSDNGEHYFALVKNDKVFLRSEGYTTAEYRDNGIESVLKNKDNRDRFSVEKKRGLEYVVLKSSGGHEIARSCPMKDGAVGWLPGAVAATAAASAAAVVTPKATTKKVVEASSMETSKVAAKTIEREPVAAAGGTVGGSDNGGCMKWLPWLIGLALLGLLLLFLLRGCNKETVVPAAVTEKAAAVVEEVKEAAVEVKEEVKEVVKKVEPKYEPPSTKGYKSSGF